MRPRNPPHLDPRRKFPAFATSIGAAMARLGLTSRQTAALSGFNVATIYGYERGMNRPSLANIGRLEKALGAKLDMSEPGKLANHDPAATRSRTRVPSTGASGAVTLQDLVKSIHALGFAVELRPLGA